MIHLPVTPSLNVTVPPAIAPGMSVTASMTTVTELGPAGAAGVAEGPWRAHSSSSSSSHHHHQQQ